MWLTNTNILWLLLWLLQFLVCHSLHCKMLVNCSITMWHCGITVYAVITCLCVSVWVCLSRFGIVWKRLNIELCKQCHMMPQGLCSFLMPKTHFSCETVDYTNNATRLLIESNFLMSTIWAKFKQSHPPPL